MLVQDRLEGKPVGCELRIKPPQAIDTNHGSRISIGIHRGERCFDCRSLASGPELHLRVHGEHDLGCSTV